MIDLTQSTCNDELSLSELTVTLVRDVIPEGNGFFLEKYDLVTRHLAPCKTFETEYGV